MDKVRFGIVGFGNMGTGHCKYLNAGEIEGATLAAICDIKPAKLEMAKEAYPDFYDTVLMNMRMENGCIAHVDGAQGVQYGYDARVEIVGTKGSIQIGGLQQGTTLLYTKEGLRGDVVNSWRTLFSEAYFQEDVSFVDCILNDTAPKVTGWDGRKAVEIVRAGNESIRTGNVVQIRGGCR